MIFVVSCQLLSFKYTLKCVVAAVFCGAGDESKDDDNDRDDKDEDNEEEEEEEECALLIPAEAKAPGRGNGVEVPDADADTAVPEVLLVMNKPLRASHNPSMHS